MKILSFLIFSLTLVIFINTTSFSFEKADSTEKNGDILKTRPFVVQFAIGQNFILENFKDLNFSIKKHISRNFALRFGLGVNITDQDLSGNETYSGFKEEIKQQRYGYTAVLDFNYYFNPSDIIKAYIGLGPYFNYDNNYYKSELKVSNAVASELQYYQEKSTSIGGTILAGVEWFVTERLSLMAEYNFLFTYSWDDYNYHNRFIGQSGTVYDDYSYLNGNTINIRGEKLKFGISVYF